MPVAWASVMAARAAGAPSSHARRRRIFEIVYFILYGLLIDNLFLDRRPKRREQWCPETQPLLAFADQAREGAWAPLLVPGPQQAVAFPL